LRRRFGRSSSGGCGVASSGAGALVAAGIRRLQAAAQGGRYGECHVRLFAHQAEEARAVQAQQLTVRLCADGGGSGTVGEQRHLAERIAGAKNGNPAFADFRPCVYVYTDVTPGHEVEGVARISLAKHVDAPGQRHRHQARGELCQSDAVQTREQLNSSEQIGVLSAR
jgi:hypothetical protein